MASEPKGYIRVPVWVDGGVVKPLVNDDGRIPVVLELSDIIVDVNLKTSDITLGVTESSPLTSIQSQLYGWDLSNWCKNPIVYGYTNRVSAADIHTKSGAGDYFLELLSVPAGYIYIIQVINSRNRDTVVNQEHIISAGARDIWIEYFENVVADKFAISNNRYYVLKQDDVVQIAFRDCLDTDRLQVRGWGYSMKINE